MRVKIDEDLCIACGLCEESVPDVFHLEDDVAEVIVDEVPADLEDSVREAASDCPVSAITVIET